ncbi:MAG TPA: hypothetical protein EYQ11_00455 [Candidatus Poseidoniales archaeon]|jgi:hypothetical protein|nr:MAG: hypothetical protein CXT66_04575 [Euryarchaeota archaeon]HIG33340.1 hypothetical protein [Candidatus Poseidoniales archaeon]HIL67039.1 hypothetical protein [Candidatus Poseidoniales archaeon]
MSTSEDSRNLLGLEKEIDSMISALETETPAAPDIKGIVKEDTKPKGSSIKSTLKAREAILTGVDDLLISRGARLILFLPIVVVLLFGLAQSYRSSEPDWWQVGVQELFFDFTFSKSIYLLALVLMVADLLLLFVLHYLLWTTKRIFQIETEEIVSTGITFRSSHGYSEMRAVIDGAANQLNLTTTLMIFSTGLLGLALIFPSDTDGIPVLIAVSTGALLSGHSVYMVSNRPRFNTVEPWGLLEAFSPPIHPALLNMPFTDVIRSHVDPMLAVRFSKYVSSFTADLQKGVKLSDLQEYLLQVLDMFRSGLIEEEEFHQALGKLVDSRTIDQIINHPELGEETLDRLLMHARDRCAPFFRLNDRMRMHLSSQADNNIWFDVDMENLTHGQANLFAYVLNQTEESQDLILRVQTPDFRPNECEYRLRAEPHSHASLSGKTTYERMSSTIAKSRIVWQTLIPSSMGDATVTVRLEDSSGNLISGKVLTSQVRSDLFTRLRMTTGAVFMFGAALAIISPILPFAARLLGL